MAGSSYWSCPICLRRVPERVLECYCGRKRQPTDGPEAAGPGPGTEGGGRGPLVAVVALAAVAAVAYGLLRKPEPVNVPGPAARASEERPAPADALAPRAPARPSPSQPPAWGALRVAPSAAPAGEGSPSDTAPPKPTPTPADSVDAQRERGAASYEAAMKNLSGRLGSLRGLVKHYTEQCGGGAVLVIGCDAPREQIAQTLHEIQAALDEAEETARRSWVDPGVQRAIRDRSGMDDVTVGEALAAARAATRN